MRIAPHLWYDKEAKEAAAFYVSVFGHNSKVNHVTTIHNTPSGDADIVSFELLGREFMAISAGPFFKFNPSVSLQVLCETKDEVDALWGRLSEGGTVLMELGSYPFSERYGWVQDKYGLSWQLAFFGGSEARRKIIPMLLFVGPVCGKAEEAINFWTSLFPESKVDSMLRHDKGEEPDKEGTVKYATFSLLNHEFAAMDSAHEHNFAFNEAVSFVVHCSNQAEIDYYWERLSAVPEAEQCGWLEDKYGLSWQIVPTVMEEMMKANDPAKLARVTEAFLKMKKFDIAELERAASAS